MERWKRFNGMFAFALWDSVERVLHLACDRFGEKPLYFGFAGSQFVFGSELKALAAHPAFDTSINEDVIPLFLRYGYIPMPWSIYRNASKLEPGTYVTLRSSDLTAHPKPVAYWSTRGSAISSAKKPFRGSSEDAANELEKLLADSVRIRMLADVPLGAFLSGGIDSSMIVALMQRYSSRPAQTFTIGFSEQWYDESTHARNVAKHLGTEHTELFVTPKDAMSVIPRLSAIYDEPFADSSQVPTFLVSQLARRHVTVALSGDGGDEVFGGYNRYVWAGQVWNWTRRYPPSVRSFAGRLVTSISPTGWDKLNAWTGRRIDAQAPGNKMHKLAGILDAQSQEEIYQRLISQWQEPQSVMARHTNTLADSTGAGSWDVAETFLQRMMLSDAVGYLPNDILVKVDRAAMAVSLETRTPYLDHRLFEFAWSLPDDWKIREGQSKWLLRQVLYRFVP